MSRLQLREKKDRKTRSWTGLDNSVEMEMIEKEKMVWLVKQNVEIDRIKIDSNYPGQLKKPIFIR